MKQLGNIVKVIVPLLGFILLIGIIIFIFKSENDDLEIEIDNLNAELQIQDSIQNSLYDVIDTYQGILDSARLSKVDCPPNLGYKLNGRSLTSDDLFDMLLDSWDENDSLQIELVRNKNYLEYIRMNWGLEVSHSNDSYTIQPKKGSRIQKNENRLFELETLIKKIERNYPIKYKIESGDDYIVVKFLPNQLDTAMYLYPYFKDRIKKEKDGYIILK